MRTKSASGVLASFRSSPYQMSTTRFFTRCGLAGRPFCASCGDCGTNKTCERRATSCNATRSFVIC
ncbi:MAG: hypothetical protein GDA65_09765 [Nitrospira sp. CR1.1]|nr:hypothetical protein [Nitrospira sp. CR1.1]